MNKYCFCGCGRRVSRTFAPGHDTKFVFDVLREQFSPLDTTIGEALAAYFSEAAENVQQDNGGHR